MHKLILPIFLSLFISCKKERFIESTISGSYALVTVKENIAGKRDKVIEHPYHNARFNFNNANEVSCQIGNDTLYGGYEIVYRWVSNDGENSRRERGMVLSLTDFRRTRFINWTLWNIDFRRTYEYMVGHQDRQRGTYRFEFKRL